MGHQPCRALLCAALLGHGAAAALAQPDTPPTPTAPATPAGPTVPPELTAAHAAFEGEDWPAAVENYLAALGKGVDAPLLHFRLGYSLHMLKRYEEALTHHLKATGIQHPALRIDALYNCACANALLGRQDDALDFFQRAIDAGFKDTNQVGIDADLDSLRDDPRFVALVASIGRPRFRQDVAWSPDSTRIAYSEFDGCEPFDVAGYSVWTAAADGSERRRLADSAMWVTWSGDGERIVFSAKREGNWDLCIVDADGGDEQRLTDDPAEDRQPACSPDGTRIAFCSDRGGDEDIWVLPLAGGKPTRLTSDPAKDFNPAWSADGKSIVFFRQKGDGKDQVYVVDAAGGSERRVTEDEANNVFPCFAPDGRVAYIAGGKDRAPALMVAGEGGASTVETGGERVFLARWSPDGKSIAAVAGGWPGSRIVVIDAGSGTARVVLE